MKPLSQDKFIYATLFALIFTACSPSAPGLFSRKSPHEEYAQRLNSAGLQSTALGRRWFQAAGQSLLNPTTVTLPYKEAGYFPAEKPQAASFRFAARRGEKVVITLEKKPVQGFALYADLWEPGDETGNKPRLLSAADSASATFDHVMKNDGQLILRIQPELLQSGEYTVAITTGPSLAFPIPPAVKSSIASLWGAARDAGARKHEGIDIFAPFRSPAVASGDGTVYQVNENNLGGKVVFLHLSGTNYTLYYAHLDTQMVHIGQRVKLGDTLGLTGNTGNARFTASHLHFGIYTSGGPIDPLHFVNPLRKKPENPSSNLALIGKQARLVRRLGGLAPEPAGKPSAGQPLDMGTLIEIIAVSASSYKVSLPDGLTGYVHNKDVVSIEKPLKKAVLRAPEPLYERADSTTAKKTVVKAGTELQLLAKFSSYYYVKLPGDTEGWLPEATL